MRRAVRWLVAIAILAILSSVGATYLQRRASLEAAEPEKPKPLEAGLDGRFGDYKFTENDGDKPKFTIRAKNGRQIREPSVFELEGLELQIYRDNAKVFDLVTSSKAEFDMAEKSLFSDGQVDIVRGLPAEGQPPKGRLVKIHTSGVHYSSATGKATTDRAASFDFDRGSGSAQGVDYDPATGELFMRDHVVIDWKSKNPKSPLMHIESGEAVYLEKDSKVQLRKWSKLKRGTLTIEGGATGVTLDHDAIRTVDTQNAKGSQDDPGRRLEFGADILAVNFADEMAVESIQGRENAKLVSTAPRARTTITGNQFDLVFTPSGHEGILREAVSTGASVAEAVPLGDTSDTRTLRSEIIRLYMRGGGREIDRVETDGPGTLELTPNRAGNAKRNLKGDRFFIVYGAENRVQSLRTANVTTETERPKLPKAVTRSKEFQAQFDPASGQLNTIEQKTAFEYEEGDRKAWGDRAVLDQLKQTMTLDGGARVFDPTGTANADHLELDQKTGDYLATGGVTTTRQPLAKASSSPMLSTQEVTQARAQKLVATNRGQKLHYEGQAAVWQSANRLEAEKIDIDQEKRVVEARGNVVSQFADKAPNDAKGKARGVIFTQVKAPEFDYAESTRIANYRGNVTLTRPGLTVTGRQLQAFLNDAKQENSLEKAITDGNVKIVSINAEKRVRTATSEHAEYYTEDQRLFMEGGQPEMTDSIKGKTTGRQLTWWANSDRLLVDGELSKPTVSTIRKK